MNRFEALEQLTSLQELQSVIPNNGGGRNLQAVIDWIRDDTVDRDDLTQAEARLLIAAEDNERLTAQARDAERANNHLQAALQAGAARQEHMSTEIRVYRSVLAMELQRGLDE